MVQGIGLALNNDLGVDVSPIQKAVAAGFNGDFSTISNSAEDIKVLAGSAFGIA